MKLYPGRKPFKGLIVYMHTLRSWVMDLPCGEVFISADAREMTHAYRTNFKVNERDLINWNRCLMEATKMPAHQRLTFYAHPW